MSPIELRATLSLAGLFSLRMLGLFMILPVFAIYGTEFDGATALLVGVAIGAYGLTQSVLQIPFGLLSDRLGRKPIIIAGLILFCIGSVVAATADSIYGVIAGRALQGAGAIASTLMALLSDLTSDENRTKAMASVGASIGVSFSIALVVGPVLAAISGVAGIFWLTAVLAVVGIAVTLFVVPTPAVVQSHRDSRPVLGQFWEVARSPELLRLNVGVFLLHLFMTACFVVVPLLLLNTIGMQHENHWQVYLPILLGSFIAMVPLMIIAESKRKIRQVFLFAIAMLALSLGMLSLWHSTLFSLCVGLFVFFWAFNLLEAMLPSMVSKIAPAGSKGTSMGAYSSSQFLGAFFGGLCGGFVYGQIGLSSVFLICSVLALVWFMIAFGMKQPRFLHSYRVGLKEPCTDHAELIRRFLGVEGVEEAIIASDENAAYLKVDKNCLDDGHLRRISDAAC
ncbi:MAG: MFS transporter [Moraxellaceae bacterium]|nr:MAG: MFS transporter [Moraxellaceae bacterium]